MYFNLKSGLVDDQSGGPLCHLADGNLWFDLGAVEVSIAAYGPRLDSLCWLLTKADSIKEYMDTITHEQEFYMALEEEDAGARNLLFMGKDVQLIVNLPVKIFKSLILFLRTAQAENAKKEVAA